MSQAGSTPFLFAAWRGFDMRRVGGDLVAGLTLWAVLVPEALAYAAIARVPPVTGLYAVVPAALLYALFGSSRHLVVGPMSATAALSAAAVAPLAGRGVDVSALTAAVALLAGAVALVAGLLRLGFVAGFISEPVLKGFIIAMALTIIAGQLPALIGVPQSDGGFPAQIAHVAGSLGRAQSLTVAVGLASLAALIALKLFARRLPGSLIVVLAAIAAVHLWQLDAGGLAIVGPIRAGLPHLVIPDVPIADYLALLGPTAGLAVVGFAEGLGAGKEYAAANGYEIDANRELVAIGLANLGAGLAGGMVVGGSLSKTAVNAEAGARSPISALTSAALTLATLLLLMPLFRELPTATLAAIVIVAVVDLIDVRSLRGYYRLWDKRIGSIYGRTVRADFIASLCALAGVLVFGTLPGLGVGVGVSIVLLLYRASRPHIVRLGRLDGAWVDADAHPQAVQVPGVCVARVEGGLFFVDADAVRAGLLARLAPGDSGIVLDAGTVPMIDLTAARMLLQLAERLDTDGKRLVVTSPVGEVREFVQLADGSRVPFAQALTVDDGVAQLRSDPPA